MYYPKAKRKIQRMKENKFKMYIYKNIIYIKCILQHNSLLDRGFEETFNKSIDGQ